MQWGHHELFLIFGSCGTIRTIKTQYEPNCETKIASIRKRLLPCETKTNSRHLHFIKRQLKILSNSRHF